MQSDNVGQIREEERVLAGPKSTANTPLIDSSLASSNEEEDINHFNIQILPEGLQTVQAGARFVLDITPDMLLPGCLRSSTGFDEPLDDLPDAGNAADVQNQLDVQPEAFEVEGEPCENKTPEREKTKRKADAKQRRSRGLEYTSSHSGKKIPSRLDQPLGPACDPTTSRCNERKFFCTRFTEEQRKQIKTAYFNIGDTQTQREWIARHVEVKETQKGGRGRRTNTLLYHLPQLGEMEASSSSKLPVCKNMFLGTLGISERPVRTALGKLNDEGVMDKCLQGERSNTLKANDKRIRDEIKAHIERFPKMESHYCRSSSSYQYLSSDLNLSIMYEMYKKEHPTGASRFVYNEVFHSLKLKFHIPKKDQCGVCSNFYEATEEGKEELREAFERHSAEKKEGQGN